MAVSTAETDSLLSSIVGGPVLAPDELAGAFVDATKSDRLAEIRAAVATKPGPRIPPRYESEVRTWLARTSVEGDATYARLQAYAALHLDPNNHDAATALDEACAALGDAVRSDTWTALVHSYPEVATVREMAANAGCEIPERQSVRARGHRGRRSGRSDDAVLVDAGDVGVGDSKPARAEVASRDKRDKRDKRSHATGICALVPALEPDSVKADRLAVLHLIGGVDWTALDDNVDPLSWALRRLAGEEVPELTQASGTEAYVSLVLHPGDAVDPTGMRYGQLLRRMRAHPAVICWVVRRELDSGDVAGAIRVRNRFGEAADVPSVLADEFAELDGFLSVTRGDVEAGWTAWQAGTLPPRLRARLAEALHEAGRERDADEVLGLPDVPADEIDDVSLLAVRFDLLFLDGDTEGALVQARRMMLLRLDEASVGRLWLALAFCGALTELVEREADDIDAVSSNVDDVVAAVRPLLRSRMSRLLEALVERVSSARSDLQELAKGKTIRDADVFAAAVSSARSHLEALLSSVERLEGVEPGSYPVEDEGLIALVASGRAMQTCVVGDEVIVEASTVSPTVLEDPAVSALLGRAQELAGRGQRILSLCRFALGELDALEADSGRTDMARRRVEDRISGHARAAAQALTDVVEALAD